MTTAAAARDPLTAEPSRVTSLGAYASASQTALFGDSFLGTTVDEVARWNRVVANGGTTPQDDGQIGLYTSTNASGSARLSSIKSFPLFSGGEMIFSATMSMFNVPSTDNDRFIGIKQGNVFSGFRLSDSSWQAVAGLGGGGESVWDINDPRADALAWMKLQMRMTKSRIQFLANDKLVHSYDSVGKQATLHFGSNVQVWIENTNSGSTTDNQMGVLELSLVRTFESWPAEIVRKRITADGIVARGPCWYLGTKKVSGTGTVHIHDALDASGGDATKIDEWTGVTYAEPPSGPIPVTTAIYADVSAAEPAYIEYALA